MENKFKVGDRIKCVRDQKVIYKGTVVLIYNNGNLGINENWRDHYFVCYPEEIELDTESQEPMKTELDNQTKTLRDEFALAALPAIIEKFTRKDGSITHMENIAIEAYKYATAMLTARETTREAE